MVAELSLGGRGKDGLRELGGLGEALGKLDAADGAVGVVGLLSGTGEVAADDALDGHGLGLLDEHGAAGEVIAVLLELGREVRDLARDHVVGHEIGEALEPERRDAGKDLALVGDLVGQDEVVRGDAVAGNHEQAVAAVVDVAHLAVRIRTLLNLGHRIPRFRWSATLTRRHAYA